MSRPASPLASKPAAPAETVGGEKEGKVVDEPVKGAHQAGPAGPGGPGGPGKPADVENAASPLQNFLLLGSVFLSMFLVTVDRTVIAPAIPPITNDFNSLNDVGWYGSVYLLTCCAFQLLFGKLYALYPAKIVLLTSLVIFEASSALCGAAPNSQSFIVGRAFAGVGSAGIFAGTIVTIVHTIPLAKRPQAQGTMGAVMGIATIIGPLIGGAFASNVSWRWCFYINLPFGGVSMVAIMFFFRVPNKSPAAALPLKEKILSLDLLGTALLIPTVTCLLVALQWGGQQYEWSDKVIIVLLVLTGVLFIAFVAVQIFLPKTATVPPRLLKNRSVAAALLTITTIGSAQYIMIYYIPIWFQAVHGVEAVNSGIQLLPLMISFVVASIAGGFLNQRIGYYSALGIPGAAVMAVGAGLLTTWQVDTNQGRLIGYQILFGAGMGLCFQVPNLATQTVLPRPDVPMGIALMFFGQLLGAAIFISVGSNVLSNELLKNLRGIDGYDKLRGLIQSGGVNSVIEAVTPEQRPRVLVGYNDALRQVFIVALVLSCLAVLGTASMEFKSVTKVAAQNKAKAEAAAAAAAAAEGEKHGQEKV